MEGCYGLYGGMLLSIWRDVRVYGGMLWSMEGCYGLYGGILWYSTGSCDG